MAKLNKDVLYYIFQNLHEIIITNEKNTYIYKKSLHSCLLVNKLWCEVMIPILWSYPYKYVYKDYLLLDIIISHLSDNSIELLKDKYIIAKNFQKQKLLFNYVKFCKYLNGIHNIFLQLEEEFYKLFISECSSIKCLSSEMLYYPIYKYPGANISLSNLFELECFRSDQNIYHELAQICRSIEKIYVGTASEYSGVAELIEMQKQIKYIYIKVSGDCERIVQALEKHVNSIVYFEADKCTSSLYILLSKLINLQFIRIHKSSIYFEEYAMNASCYKLQILELYHMPLNIAINIIQNTNGNLWKIKIRLPGSLDKSKEYNQAIHKYCPNIKYVTVYLFLDGTLEELENIFIKCQHLVAIDIHEYINEEYFDKFLDLLVNSASPNLYKINIDTIPESSESLKSFFINWNHKGKKTLHLYDCYKHWHKYVDKMEGIIVCDYYKDDFWNHDIIDFFWNEKH
jgi:hypothetical protein